MRGFTLCSMRRTSLVPSVRSWSSSVAGIAVVPLSLFSVEVVLNTLSIADFFLFYALLEVMSGDIVCCGVTRFKGIIACS